jgi:hypothetical protein
VAVISASRTADETAPAAEKKEESGLGPLAATKAENRISAYNDAQHDLEGCPFLWCQLIDPIFSKLARPFGQFELALSALLQRGCWSSIFSSVLSASRAARAACNRALERDFGKDQFNPSCAVASACAAFLDRRS